MEFDGRASFSQAYTFLRSIFVWYFNTLDKIYILGNFSMLDFSIALLILGAILPILIKTVSNYSQGAISSHDRRKQREERKQD